MARRAFSNATGSTRCVARAAGPRLHARSARRSAQGAIVLDGDRSAADLPAGWTDEQDGGTYRLRRRDDEALFGHNAGPHSWKSFLFPPAADGSGRARRGAGRRHRGRPRRPPTRRATPSSACAPATCTRSRSRTGSSWAARTSTRTTRRGARARSSSPSTAARPAGTCFCVSMGTGPAGDRGLRPRADRGARRRRHRFVRRGRQRARAPRCSPSCRTRAGRAERRARPRAAVASARPARWAASWTPTDIKELLLPQPRAPALGRGRRPLPDLRQLHDGLPDLLLHHRRGRDRPGRRRGRARRACGTPASRWTSPTSTAAASARSTALALPPVDDAQARHLDRPVRHARAASAAGAASPGARWRSTSPRRPRRSARPTASRRRCRRDRRAARRGARVFAGMARRAPRADRGLRAEPLLRRRASTCSARASRPTRFYVDPPRPGRARDLRARGAAR